ncbi:type VI secretion system protein TssL, long form [Ruegeria jejuensis]|uniref:type VI secretion system protein TssL, long form n=1 Tax=Ruegeria jejuensis TaxID=3233338 RepID=UPI00355C07F5
MTAASSPPDGKDEPLIVLPTPGKKRDPVRPAPEAEPVADPISVPDILAGFRLDGSDLPVVVAEAAPLLNLAHALRKRELTPDLSQLRRETIAAVKDYEKRLGAAGIVPLQARAAHYVVCATLDDVIRNRPWGEGWAIEGLVSTFHHDVTGGDKVFELLRRFQQEPGTYRDILMLIYLCLSLGFEGRTRVSARGGLELAQIRDNLYRVLRQHFDGTERDLSPHWQGEDAAHMPLRRGRMFWLLSGLALLLLSLIFLAFTLLLGRATNGTLDQMATLPPDDVPTLFIPVATPPPTPPPAEAPPLKVEPVVPEQPIAPPSPPPIEVFISFLQPEVEQGLVTLLRDGDSVLVRIANSGAFGVGAAWVEEDFEPLFHRIGQALAAEDFNVTVLGHTDNLPIRAAPYPSNFHLSTARANAVRDILVGYVPSDSVDIRGEADTRPIASNDTPEGRERNRRTEILVRGAGDRVDPQFYEPQANPSEANQ